jgi:hypothetical protein
MGSSGKLFWKSPVHETRSRAHRPLAMTPRKRSSPEPGSGAEETAGTPQRGAELTLMAATECTLEIIQQTAEQVEIIYVDQLS